MNCTKNNIIHVQWVLLILILSSFQLISCKKKERIHYAIDDQIKQLACFKQGSYWIFENQSTYETDCVFINKPLDFFTENQLDPEDEPLIDYIYVYLNGPLFTKFALVGNCLFGYYGNISSWVIYFSDVGKQDPRDMGYSTYELVEICDSVIINGTKFFQVLHTRYASLVAEGSIDSLINDFYLAPGIGVIQMKKHYPEGDTIRSLLRYHVIQ